MCLHLYMIEFEFCTNSLSSFYPSTIQKTETLRSAFLPLLHGSFTFSNLSHVLWRPCHGCRHWRAGAPLWWFGGARWAQLGRGAWQFVRRPSCIQMFLPNFSRNENNWKTIFVDDLVRWIWCTRWMLQFWSRLRRGYHKPSSIESKRVGAISSDKCGIIWSTYTLIMYFCFGKGHVARHQECWLGKARQLVHEIWCGDTLHV